VEPGRLLCRVDGERVSGRRAPRHRLPKFPDSFQHVGSPHRE
jgi:hypothetical protein